MKIIAFTLCLDNKDTENDFVPAKLYPVLEPLENDPQDYLRVIDESGEDYLYPAKYFQLVDLSSEVKTALINHFETTILALT
ncbi:MAG TPA: hypothetical protein VGO50_21085 [Pyrinomonadaceae bacterium]|jgi:hypothetical protein|nr:hypothetical protein [Pyrinomonadaceae bacterium]